MNSELELAPNPVHNSVGVSSALLNGQESVLTPVISGQQSEAMQLLREGIAAAKSGNRAEARDALLNAVNRDERNETAWLWLASISEQPTELLGFLEKVLGINPQNERALEWLRATKSLLAKSLIQRGAGAAKEGNNREAMDLLMQATDYEPNNEMAWLWLASVADDPEDKLSYLQRVLNINPNNEKALSSFTSVKKQMARTLLRKGSVAAVSGERETAREILREVMEFDANIEDAWLLQAYLSDSVTEKMACLEKVLQINPDNEGARHNLAALQTVHNEQYTIPVVKSEEPAETVAEPDAYRETVAEQTIEPAAQLTAPETETAAEQMPTAQFSTLAETQYIEETAHYEVGDDFSLDIPLDEEEELAATAQSSEAGMEIYDETAPQTPEVVPETEVEPETISATYQIVETAPEMVEDSSEAVEIAVETVSDHHLEAIAENVATVEVTAENEIAPQAVFENGGFDAVPQLEDDFEVAGSEAETESAVPEMMQSSFSITKMPVNDSYTAQTVTESELTEESAPHPVETDYAAENPYQGLSFSAPQVNPAVETVAEVMSLKAWKAEVMMPDEKVVEATVAAVEPMAEYAAPVVEAFESTAEEAFESTVEYAAPNVEYTKPMAEYAAPAFSEEFLPVNLAPAEIAGLPLMEMPDATENEYDAMPMPEETVENAVRVENHCPLCQAALGVSATACRNCNSLLSYENAEEFLHHEGVKQEKVHAAIERLQIEQALRPLTAEEYLHLSLGYLNLKNFKHGHSSLQNAVQLMPEDTTWHQQLKDLETFLNELENGEKLKLNTSPAGKIILVVDDSPTVRKLITVKLEKHGHRVIVAADGLDALSKMTEATPDLILLDITMPRMDGYQLCKLVKGNTNTKHIPVVMISGKDGFFDKVRGRMAGSTAYITKPFGPETLIRTIETYCNH